MIFEDTYWKVDVYSTFLAFDIIIKHISSVLEPGIDHSSAFLIADSIFQIELEADFGCKKVGQKHLIIENG